MFIAAQFTIAKYWKQPKCPSANEWIQKRWPTLESSPDRSSSSIRNPRSRHKVSGYTPGWLLEETCLHTKRYNREPSTWQITLLEPSFDRTHTSYVQTCSKFHVNIQVRVQSQQQLDPYKPLLHKCFFLNRFQTHTVHVLRDMHMQHENAVTCPHPLVLLWVWCSEHPPIHPSWDPEPPVETHRVNLAEVHLCGNAAHLAPQLLTTLPYNLLPVHV